MFVCTSRYNPVLWVCVCICVYCWSHVDFLLGSYVFFVYFLHLFPCEFPCFVVVSQLFLHFQHTAALPAETHSLVSTQPVFPPLSLRLLRPVAPGHTGNSSQPHLLLRNSPGASREMDLTREKNAVSAAKRLADLACQPEVATRPLAPPSAAVNVTEKETRGCFQAPAPRLALAGST